jgi:hypothetical protein
MKDFDGADIKVLSTGGRPIIIVWQERADAVEEVLRPIARGDGRWYDRTPILGGKGVLFELGPLLGEPAQTALDKSQ